MIPHVCTRDGLFAFTTNQIICSLLPVAGNFFFLKNYPTSRFITGISGKTPKNFNFVNEILNFIDLNLGLLK